VITLPPLTQDFFGGVFFTLMVVGNFVGMIATAALLGRPRKGSLTKVKLEPFECGFPTDIPTPNRLPVTLHIAGLLLLIFDVETVFLYPWAVTFRAVGLPAFWEMLVFVGMLLIGYWYLLKRGAFRW